jgi:hypothetical protein
MAVVFPAVVHQVGPASSSGGAPSTEGSECWWELWPTPKVETGLRPGSGWVEVQVGPAGEPASGPSALQLRLVTLGTLVPVATEITLPPTVVWTILPPAGLGGAPFAVLYCPGVSIGSLGFYLSSADAVCSQPTYATVLGRLSQVKPSVAVSGGDGGSKGVETTGIRALVSWHFKQGPGFSPSAFPSASVAAPGPSRSGVPSGSSAVLGSRYGARTAPALPAAVSAPARPAPAAAASTSAVAGPAPQFGCELTAVRTRLVEPYGDVPEVLLLLAEQLQTLGYAKAGARCCAEARLSVCVCVRRGSPVGPGPGAVLVLVRLFFQCLKCCVCVPAGCPPLQRAYFEWLLARRTLWR